MKRTSAVTLERRVTDVARMLKTSIARRLACEVDPTIEVIDVSERFPSTRSIAAVKRADVVVACLDRFDAREDVNLFCRRYLIPLVDVGMSITSNGERLWWMGRSSSPCPGTRASAASS